MRIIAVIEPIRRMYAGHLASRISELDHGNMRGNDEAFFFLFLLMVTWRWPRNRGISRLEKIRCVFHRQRILYRNALASG